jgi:hypothetical protein
METQREGIAGLNSGCRDLTGYRPINCYVLRKIVNTDVSL